LANITGYSQTSGDFTIAGTGNILYSTSGTITQSGTGQVSLAGNLNATNGLDVTGITTLGDGGTTDYVSFSATGDLTFIGAANLIQKSDGALTLNTIAQNLTVSTTTSGDLALTSADALNLTGDAASTWSIGTGNALTLTSQNFRVDSAGNITVAAGQGLDTIASGILNIGNTTATTVNVGNTAATTLAIGAGGALTRAINIGTGTGIDTIKIGTGGTLADDIDIGDALADISITGDDWSITDAGAATFTSLDAGSGAISGGAGSFTTLTSSGNTTLATGASTTNTFGAGDSSINTIGSTASPGALTLHGATNLDNTFTVSGSNLTTLGGDLTVSGTTITASSAALDVDSLTVGGGYGSTGVTISNIGNIQADGTLTVGALTTPYTQTKTVAKAGGDHATIQAAIDALTCSAASPCLVRVMPGVYAEQVTINNKSYIDVVSSGGPGVTRIVPASGSQAVLVSGTSGHVRVEGFGVEMSN
jgi:hypothetical protein